MKTPVIGLGNNEVLIKDSTSSGALKTKQQNCLSHSNILTLQHVVSYPMSSEDIHWADHTENQQHPREDGDHNDPWVIHKDLLPVALIWKNTI